MVFASSLLNNNKRGNFRAVSEVDLPVEGDATRVMSNNNNDDNINNASAEIDVLPKPIWWYLFLFPLWCKIARIGKDNMNDKIRRDGNLAVLPNDRNSDDSLVSSRREFYIAIFFVVFGVVSVIAGVGSNLYVQI